MAGRSLFKTVVVGVDGGEGGRDALALAARLQRTFGSRVIAVMATPGEAFVSRASSPAYEAAVRDEARETLARELGRAVVDAAPEVVSASSPRRALHAAAREHAAELIVVGPGRHRPLARLLGRDVTAATLHGAPCPVAVAARGLTAMPPRLRTVAVGFDDSAQSRIALDLARAIAQAAAARLRLLWVVPAPIPVDPSWNRSVSMTERDRGEADRARALMAEMVAALGDDTVGETVPGLAHEELAQLCHDADLLVVGSRGDGVLGRLLRGSTSTRLVRQAACPVLVVPRDFTCDEAATETPTITRRAA
jgi:nucleotide-binding universal stress UspA family protein